MKIVVLNHTDVRVELLNVVDSLCPDEIEEFLYDRGFDVLADACNRKLKTIICTDRSQ